MELWDFNSLDWGLQSKNPPSQQVLLMHGGHFQLHIGGASFRYLLNNSWTWIVELSVFGLSMFGLIE